MLQIFSVLRLGSDLLKLVIAAFFTSGSLSLRRRLNVWMRLLSVMSFPKASANFAKFLAKHRRTFQDLSSPALSSEPSVCTLFSSFDKCPANGIRASMQRTRIASWSS